VSWSEKTSRFSFGGWGRGSGFFFFKIVFGVESGLSTVHFPLGQWTMNFPCKPCGGVKSNSSQVPDMFPGEFTIGPHFYVWQMLGQRGRALYFKLEPSILGSLQRLFFIVMAQSNWLIANLQKKKTLARHLI
jgi:hypothetical protein